MVITAGIDTGNKWTKVVILKDGRVASTGMVRTGFEQRNASREALQAALKKAGITRGDVQFTVATGAGREIIDFASHSVTEVSANARGAVFLYPGARTVVDVGAEESRVMKVDGTGKLVDFTVNEKCAAGAGSFVETMARALEVSIGELGELSLKSSQAVSINAQCVVFAESEVISLIHANTGKEDIARAVNEAIAGRIISMVRRVGMEKELLVAGGLARNPGFVKSMEDGLGVKAIIPGDPEFVSALGAALAGVDKLKE